MAISAKFEADFSQFTTAVKGAEASLKGLETSAQTLGPAILASLASGELRRFASDVTNVAQQFIGAFAEEEAAVKKLSVALEAQNTTAALGQYTALAAEFQKTTVFSDDLIFSMQALLVQVGGVMPAQMQAALTAATNLSAGLGIDLRAATMLVGKAFAGETGSLTRYGIVIDETKLKTEGASAVLQAINDKFGGQATAQVETYTGRMAQLSNQMSDFKEKVGGLLVEALTPLMNAFASLPDGMQTVIVGLVALGVALAPLAISGAALTAILVPLATALGITMAGALATLGALLLPAGLVIGGIVAVYLAFRNWDAITGFAKAVYDGVKLWLVDKFTAVVAWVKERIAQIVAAFQAMYMAVSGGSIVPDMVSDIADEFKKLDRVMVQPVIKATQQTVQGFTGLVAGAPTLHPSVGSGGGVSVNLTVLGSIVTEQQIIQHAKDQITQSLKQLLPLRSA